VRDGIKIVLAKSLGIMEETILQNKETIKNIIKSKIKEKMWCDKELEGKKLLGIIRRSSTLI
jgi:hypothetical protein